METRSNRLLVAFVACLLIAGLVTFAWYITAGTKSYEARYRITFDQSVSGLNVGAPVSMSGVQVGQVKAISLSGDGSGRPIVEVALETRLPIRSGVRADISRSLLDGTAALVLQPSSSGRLVNPPDEDSVGVIAAVGQGSGGDPAVQAVEVSESLDKAVRRLDADGQRDIEASLSSAVRTTGEWQRKTERLLGSIPRDQVRSAGTQLRDVGNGAEKLTRTVERSRGDVANVRRSIRDAGGQLDDVGRSVEAQRPAVRGLSGKAKALERDIAAVRTTVGTVSETTAKVDPDRR